MIYIIVLSYHAPADLRRCVESVLRTDYPPERFRLVVVDNEATEETAAVLKEYAGRMDVLPQRENTGYAEGMNIGIRHALGQGAEYIACLNQDTEVDPGWLKHLVMAMEADPKIGAVQPRVMLGGRGLNGLHADSSDGFVNSIGNEIHVLGFAYAGGHRERWEDVRKRLRGFPYPEVTYCSGACVMLRKAALADIALTVFRHFDRASHRASGEIRRTRRPEESSTKDLTSAERDLSTPLRSARDDGRQFFDSSYFMYHEDVDLGVRLRLRGWKCALAPQAVVTHYYEFSRSMRKLEWMERNRILFVLENFRWATIALLAPALLASEVALAVFAVRGGWWPAKRRAWVALLHPKHWAAYHRARAARQAKRMLPDRAVLQRFTPRFANQEMPSAFVERVVNPLVVVWWAILRRVIVW